MYEPPKFPPFSARNQRVSHLGLRDWVMGRRGTVWGLNPLGLNPKPLWGSGFGGSKALSSSSLLLQDLSASKGPEQ